MPTVNTILRQVNLTADVSNKLFGLNFARANNSVLTRAPIDSDADITSSATDSNIGEVVDNYAQDRQNFNDEFDATMSSLQVAAGRLGDGVTNELPTPTIEIVREIQAAQRELTQQISDEMQEAREAQDSQRTPAENFNDFAEEFLVAENPTTAAVTPTTVGNENVDAALANVRNFVDTFNNAVDYLDENRNVSRRMNALATDFGDNKNFSQSLDAVGISVNEGGRLRVDESRLADAINENSSTVNAVLGRNGLAGRLDRNISLANSQRENLFTPVTDYAGTERNEPTESLYTAQVSRQTAEHSAQDAGKLLNMFT